MPEIFCDLHICIIRKTPQFCIPLGKPEVSPSTGNLCHHSQHFQSRWGWGFPSPHFYRKIQPRGSITMKKKAKKSMYYPSNHSKALKMQYSLCCYCLAQPPRPHHHVIQCKEVRFASFLSGGFTTMAVINPRERKLAKRTSVQCLKLVKNI